MLKLVLQTSKRIDKPILNVEKAGLGSRAPVSLSEINFLQLKKNRSLNQTKI